MKMVFEDGLTECQAPPPGCFLFCGRNISLERELYKRRIEKWILSL